MNRRILSAILALLLCCSLAVSVSAEERNISFVYDQLEYLTQEESTALSDLAWEIYQKTGVGIFFQYVFAEDIENVDVTRIAKGITNYVIMMENETHWYMYLGGLCENIDPQTEDALRAVYDETETYFEGVKAFMEATAERFAPVTAAPEGNAPEAEARLVFDDADLLSDAQEQALTAQLRQLSSTHSAQILVATVASANGTDPDDLVNHMYDSMAFGYGQARDGVLLLVCMDPREYRILSNGYAGDAIDPGVIDTIGDAIVSDLSEGDYADAFEIFAEKCDYYLDGYRNGFPFKTGRNLVISLVVGLVLALIVTSVLKGQLKSVRKQDQANSYVRDGSMQLTLSNDIFLYRNVTRTKKESSNSSGSRSGGSRSVGGGSF